MGRMYYVRSLLHKYGAAGLVLKFIEKKENPIDRAYRRNYALQQPDEAKLAAQKNAAGQFAYRPLVSIVVPTYRTDERMLRDMIESVLAQTYDKWELILADGTDDADAYIGRVAESYQCKQIRYLKLEHNGGISANTNEGLKRARGEYIAFMDHDDLLSPDALFAMVEQINEGHRNGVAPELIYSDEDKVSEDGLMHFEPHFKPDYNEELLNQYNYVCHFLMIHKSLLVQVGMLDSAYDGAQDYDFVLRCTEVLPQERIAHVSKIVYHWRVSASSTAGYSGNKDYAKTAQLKAVESHKARMMHAAAGNWKEVSDNSYSGESDYIICQGKGISPLDSDWSRQLAELFHGHKVPVGMISGRLVSPGGFWHGRVLACGYRIDHDGDVKANFAGVRRCKKGYFQRAFVPQNVTAGSLDFCVIDKEAFLRVGGYDETLPSPYRDIDFGFRLREAGYAVIVNPQVSAVARKTARQDAQDAAAALVLQQRWSQYLAEGDAFFHENICCDGYV